MPVKSRWTIPIPKCTVPTFLFNSPTAQLSDQPTFIDAERPSTHYLTQATYRQWSQRFAAGLVAAGLKPGDAVLLFSGNTIFFPVVLVGTIMAGGIFTGANPTYVAKEVAYQLENSGAKFLICSDASIDIGLEAAELVGMRKERVFVFDDGVATFEGKGQGMKGCAHWSRLIASKEEGDKFVWEENEEAPERTIVLNYSSGTTGLPKGVEITHTNYISNTLQHMHLDTLKRDFENYRKTQRWLCFLPMYHAMGQTIYCIGAPNNKVPVYIMKKFDFIKMLEAIQNFRITDLQLVPPIVVLMTKRPETKKYDLSSVVYAGSGAAPLGAESSNEFAKLWPPGKMNLKQGYGMTEFTCSILGWHPLDYSDSFAVGEPNANTEVKLVDEGGNEVPQGERGEIWGRGLNVMKGYWKNAKATAETLTPDGWMKTGDIAYVDKKGRIFVVDRKKELIKVRGLQVAPAELEAQLLEHPGIADAAVVGVTINGDEHPRAYVVRTAIAGADVTPESVAKWMEPKVSRHKRLTGGVKFVDAISKNPSGKILRRLYRDIAKEEVGDSEGKGSRL